MQAYQDSFVYANQPSANPKVLPQRLCMAVAHTVQGCRTDGAKPPHGACKGLARKQAWPAGESISVHCPFQEGQYTLESWELGVITWELMVGERGRSPRQVFSLLPQSCHSPSQMLRLCLASPEVMGASPLPGVEVEPPEMGVDGLAAKTVSGSIHFIFMQGLIYFFSMIIFLSLVFYR